ncbi:MAG: 16S rRNA (guanine(966)-N(2))-methyltransferase RsmD [Syntrophales bacterium]|nr:16S rRNA (guanine(966)-N(2))-methyltransferase RsmD [Syntrophales bacterium]
MRITGGLAKGKRLIPPRSTSLRPTTAGVREAIFNILASVEGLTFLDLYAGSGGVGLEALSRGARKVVFVEKNAKMAAFIRDMTRSMEWGDRVEVLCVEVKKAINILSNKKETYDVIFADPPYNKGLVNWILRTVLTERLLKDQGVFIIQHSTREPISCGELHSKMLEVRERQYGETALSLIRLRKGEEGP